MLYSVRRCTYCAVCSCPRGLAGLALVNVHGRRCGVLVVQVHLAFRPGPTGKRLGRHEAALASAARSTKNGVGTVTVGYAMPAPL